MELGLQDASTKLVLSLFKQLKMNDDCNSKREPVKVNVSPVSTIYSSSELPKHKRFKVDRPMVTSSLSPLTDSRYISENPLLDDLLAARPFLYMRGEKSEKMDGMTILRYWCEEVRLVMSWASKISEFRQLDVQTKMALLKFTNVKIMNIRLSFRSLDLLDSNSFRFTHNNILSLQNLPQMGWDKDLRTANINIMNELNECNMDMVEIAIFMAMILFAPDAPGISNPLKIVQLQSRMLAELQTYILRRGKNGHKRFAKILLSLAHIERISSKCAEDFNSIDQERLIRMGQICSESITEGTRDSERFSPVDLF